MATQRPISTISYNTEAFLKDKLNTWYEQHLIQAWQYICHKGEDGDKDHIHLRIEPNKKLDPMALTELLQEYVLGEEKPRGVRPWRNSKEEDWWLYAVHDEDYLKLKYGEMPEHEKLPYDWKQVRVSPFYDAETAWIRAKAAMKHNSVNLTKQLRSGHKPVDLVLQGENPLLVNQLMRTLAISDYQKQAEKLSDLEQQFSLYLSALDRAGLRIVLDPHGLPYIVPEDNKWSPARFIMPEAGPRPMPERNDDDLIPLFQPEDTSNAKK